MGIDIGIYHGNMDDIWIYSYMGIHMGIHMGNMVISHIWGFIWVIWIDIGIYHGTFTSMIIRLMIYPLVNIQKTMEKSQFLIGKSTIINGNFQ